MNSGVLLMSSRDQLAWGLVAIGVGVLLAMAAYVLYLWFDKRRGYKSDLAWISRPIPIGKIDRIDLNEEGLKAVGTLNERGNELVGPGAAQWTMPIDLDSLEKDVNETLGNVFEESNLVKHARHELEMLGEDPDVIDWFVRVIGEYSSIGHSGGSHYAILPMLNDLLSFRNLMPLTDDPDEWFFHEEGNVPGEGFWQNKRCGSSFSNDGGKTYWDLDRGGKDVIYKSRPHQEPWPEGHNWYPIQGRYYPQDAWPQPRDPRTGRFIKGS